MALTLVEAAKLAGASGNVFKEGIIEMYAKSSDILMHLPFDQISGNALGYNREETLPGVGFRGVNEAYSEDVGIINPMTEVLKIMGGDMDVDRFIVDTQGESQRATRTAMKIKASALKFTKTFLKGDASGTPAEFDGLQARIVGDQLIANGSTSGGDVLSLANLDALIDQCDEPTHLIMNKTMRRKLTAASRLVTVGGDVRFDTDSFGRGVTKYNDIPILIADYDNTGAQILPFTEANPGGGSAASTSIYCVSMAEDKLVGLEHNKGLDARDLGEIDTKPVYRTRVEWYIAFALYHGRAAARLHGIKTGAVVV